MLLATALRLSLDPLVNTNLPFTTYFVAVILTAIYFGLGPALLSMMLGAVFGAFFFVEPRHSFTFASSSDALRLLSFCLLTGGLSALIHAIQSASAVTSGR